MKKENDLEPKIEFKSNRSLFHTDFPPNHLKELSAAGALNPAEYLGKILLNAKFISAWNSEETTLIGYLAYYENSEFQYVTMLWVNQDSRSQGIAKRLMSHLINLNRPEIRLEVVENTIAHNLYLGLGFKKFTYLGNSNKLLMRRLNSIAIMQPYVFPHIQYFQLMHSVDSFVYLDDVNFRKASWINNNYIRSMNSDNLVRFNIPIKKISDQVQIAETHISQDSEWEIKFLKQLYHCYSKAPQFKSVFPLLELFVSNKYTTIAELAISANSLVNQYLEIEKSVYVSSSNFSDSQSLKASVRLISMINQSGFLHYINPIGGRSLYSVREFESEGVALHFLESKFNEESRESAPKYSIIDNLMRYQKGEIREQILEYRFV